MGTQRPRPLRVLERRAASVLSLDLGYNEVKHRSFYGADDAERIGLGDVAHLSVQNPSSREHDRMILTSAAGLLRIAAANRHREPRGRIWTASRLFAEADEGLPTELGVFGLVTWDGADSDAPTGGQFLGLLHDVRAFLARLGLRDVEVAGGARALNPALPEPTWLHPGRGAVVRRRGVTLGVVGEVLPAVVRAWQLEGRATFAELDVAALLAAMDDSASGYEPVLRYPVVPFDIALVVPRKTPAADVVKTMEAAVAGQIRDVAVFDVYEGEGIPEGHRSLALRCELFDATSTLSPKAADALRATITSAFAAKHWSVRGG